ncbi:SusC/RagA family TonB-linked outer membrane protein [Chryseobacterium bernardetii]|uniref:SusC/RagA family TonB-linked outer membrane protein n=1 Tax=Chryseobacterium bernardetii TaxID=1241978 RepID=A0A3G6TB01_9FLAO|nr:SusC/RagA family TonB-linked outer membrane protein [Chryseobacterium bernardetii]AZB23796.1 SusC/RagA family TonB-linked outer membrane protein [Chryseobacterium bernardetii]
MKKTLATFAVFLLPLYITAQEIAVSGNVKSESGISVSGVNITDKNTGKTATTDENGNFTISANPKDILEFFSPDFSVYTVEVSSKKQYSIVLKKNNEKQIEGVVITALGIAKKKEKIGYSTQEVGTKQFETITTPSIGNLFSGQVAGLNVSNPTGMQQAPQFTLRGNSNLVFVIDGVIVEKEVFQNLDPNNIENINVLKGATASALYGSRGRYGAILITTKSAKKKGFSVEFSQNTMITGGFTNLPKTQTEYGNGSQGKYEFWDGADGGVNDGDMIWGPKFVPGLKIAQWNSPIRDKVTGQVIPWYGAVTGTQYNDKARYERVPIDWKYHDNLDTFLKPAIINNNNFAISYRNNKDIYRFSGNFMNYDDRVPNSYLQRYGINFSSENHLGDKLIFDTKFNFNQTFTPNVPNYDYNPSGHMYTILIWMGADVDGKALKNHMWIPGKEGVAQANWNYAWYNNPWFGAEYYKNQNRTNIINAQTGLEYKATKDFSVKGKISIVENHNKQEIFSPYSYFNYSAPRSGGYILNDMKTWNLNYDVLATYKKKISENFDFTINAGGSAFYYKNNRSERSTDGLRIPEVYTFENSIGAIKNYTYLKEKLIYSAYSTIDIGLYNAFFINISGRNDWSSTLPKANRSYFYPSASISAVISNLVKMPESINMLKLSASWAKVAYDFQPYSIRNYYSNNKGISFNGNPTYLYPTTLNVENTLKPEQTKSYELGLSAGLFNNRITLDATYFRTLDYNNILEFPSAESSGFISQYVNGNEYTTKGFEISLGLVPVKTSNFTWKTLINWSTYEQKLTSIYNNMPNYKNIKLGERMDSYYDYTWQKSPDGQVILDAKSGMPTRANTPSNLGHFNPDWTFGFNNAFKYKKISLNIGIDGSIGGIMRSQVVEKMWWGGKHPNSVTYRDLEYANPGTYYFVPKGVNYDPATGLYTQHTKPINFQDWAQNYPYQARVTQDESEEFANVFDRTFIKLRSVVLEYDFSSLLNPKGMIKGFTANISAYNLAMWKKSKNLYSDPDFQIKTGRTDDIANDIQDPSSRWFGIGFNLKF